MLIIAMATGGSGYGAITTGGQAYAGQGYSQQTPAAGSQARSVTLLPSSSSSRVVGVCKARGPDRGAGRSCCRHAVFTSGAPSGPSVRAAAALHTPALVVPHACTLDPISTCSLRSAGCQSPPQSMPCMIGAHSLAQPGSGAGAITSGGGGYGSAVVSGVPEQLADRKGARPGHPALHGPSPLTVIQVCRALRSMGGSLSNPLSWQTARVGAHYTEHCALMMRPFSHIRKSD